MRNLPSAQVKWNEQVSTGKLLFIIGIIFVSFNLRPSITAVGPLISSIRLDTGITNAMAGFLTALPLLAFALLSPLAPKIARKVGNEATVLIALVVLTIGIFIRSTGLILTLFIGTALLGVGIAVINVIIPAIVKSRFPTKIGIMTGLYTTTMGTMAALASGLSVPLTEGLGLGWQKGLVIWGILAGLSVLFWLPQLSNQDDSVKLPTINTVKSSIWHSPLAWQVTLFMGFQSSIFYCMITWLPEILYGLGMSSTTAGWMLALLQFAGLPTTFYIPILAAKLKNQRAIVLGIGSCYLLSFIGLFIGGNMMLVTVYIILIGLGQGAGISLALTLFGLRTKDGKQAANLSGMAQSFGYLLAAIGPFTVGLIFDQSQSWTIPLLMFMAITIALMIFGVGASRDRYVFQE